MPVAENSQEKELLRDVAKGNEEAFRRLFENYHQLLGTHILRITESAELAEEVVQDVFLKIWMSREALYRIHDFRAYLFVLSKNHALNCLRKLIKERCLKKEWERDYAANTADDPGDSYHYSLIDKAIDQLPPQQQKVYLLSRHHRLTYTEISAQLNLSRETVKKYLQLATISISNYIRENLATACFFLILRQLL